MKTRRLFSFKRSTIVVQRILEAGEIESLDQSAIPRIRTPERASVFLARAARLRQLAERSNPIAGYLRLMAALADAQQETIASFKAKPPSAELIASAQKHSMPLIPALSGARDPAWRDVLISLLDKLQVAGPLTPALEQLIKKLRLLDAATRRTQRTACQDHRRHYARTPVRLRVTVTFSTLSTLRSQGNAARQVRHNRFSSGSRKTVSRFTAGRSRAAPIFTATSR